jgi:hypothetical protein
VFLLSTDGAAAVNLDLVQSLYVSGFGTSWHVEAVVYGTVVAQVSPDRTTQAAAIADLATIVAGYRPDFGS